MKILVTGGAGFVGTNLIKALLREGHDVTSVDNYSTGFEHNHQEGCKYINTDLSIEEPKHGAWGQDKFQIEKPDMIYHMAALARIQPSLKWPTKTINNNFNSTLNILEYARENEIPVVFAGSSSFHHGLWGSPYAWSKFAGEQLCELYWKVYNLPTAICRFYNVYGPHQLESGTYATVIGIFEKLHREGKPLTVTGTGEQRRDFTHIDDIVDGIIKCSLSIETVAGEIFELGRGENHSINELADMFGAEKEYIPARDGENDITLANYSKANQVLGWQPKLDLEDYIRMIVE